MILPIKDNMAVLSNAMPGSLIQAGIAYIIPTLLFCQLGVFIHRRYFSPLSKIPGPFLASFSDIYYFYYQFIKDGTLYLQYERLREQYGTQVSSIIREFSNRLQARWFELAQTRSS